MGSYDKKYFLGANSCEGFYSEFTNCYCPEDNWKAYIIKGGPGTGKSSFMKYIAAQADKAGIECELCVCSSDPQSLDGVILPKLKTVILDGTAPHVVEPVYPGACEKLLDFGQYWNDDCFRGKEAEILNVTRQNKALHKMASRYMSAAGQLILDNLKISSACTDKEKTHAFAQRLAAKCIPKKSGCGHEWIRFTQGITPLGVVSYSQTITASAKRVIPIADPYGSASGIIIDVIRQYAIEAGYDIISLKNPFLPSKLYDHIIIPELSLAFVTENEYQHFKTDERRIHARRFVNSTQLHNSRKRMQFNRKAVKQLLLSAAETLSEAKRVHDGIEKYYIHSMNFEALTAFAESFSKKLLS